ncbi:MAG: ATP-dependent DNA helicase UvrD2 [Corynebacterium sp.]|nr:ATP-dependent DNA helicase UvrD2 [Corynebacterium sp.]
MIDVSILDEDQQIAVQAPRGPVAILAGAGTGKTRTITYRIAHLIDQGFVSPERILAVTFSRKAAAEMKERLHALGIRGAATGTFHSAALRQLQYFWPRYGGKLQLKVVENTYSLIAAATGQRWGKEAMREINEEISWAKAMLITPKEYAQRSGGRTPPVSPTEMAQIYEAYEQFKYRDSTVYLDFSDMLMHMTAALENYNSVATEFRQQYRSFVVDEYQDITPLQQRLLDAWLGERDDLTVVGDANQTIYSFAGATPEYLLDFSRKYRNATVLRLQRDYRSTPEIADFANQVIGQAKGRVAGSRLELEGQRTSIDVQPEFHAYHDEEAEAIAVAERVAELIKAGHNPSEIAILYRSNFQSQRYEEALTQHNIAYTVQGEQRFFDRPAVREAMSVLMRAGNRPPPNMPMENMLRKLFEGIGHTTEKPTGRQQLQRWHALETLIDISMEYNRLHGGLSITQLVQLLQLRARQQKNPTTTTVSLATLHASKGLEWDTVFLVGLVEGNMPISHALKAGPAAIEEERRLLYVGITRARERLYLSWNTAPTKTGAPQQASRFLDTFSGKLHHASRGIQTDLPQNCKVCHAVLTSAAQRVVGRCENCPAELNPQALNALMQWRSTQAAREETPSNFILSDAMVYAIVELMPQHSHQLQAVPGMGQLRIRKYGNAIIHALRPFIK